ncbi:MAG: RNA 3'-phosphate cyclase, partial [Methanothrix sp.]|nr:RNA 3'-phosphate cyclase [Methanothrix sp.]MDD1759209.1 RNA 3'-phosphate cyclase [Methanothrix sp.]
MMIEIDGSYGEGGGQIVRTAVVLSAVTGKAVLIKKIRQGRPKPGLAPQHAQAIRTLGEICNAEIKGAEPGSSEVLFCPQEICGGSRRVEIGTAGSATLLMQCLLPALLHADERTSLHVQGGTDVRWSPTVDYFRNVFLPAISLFGGKAGLKLLRRGYYPRGQGEVILEVEPSRLKPAHIFYKPFNPDQSRISGISHCSNLPRHVAERQASSAIERLHEAGFEAEIAQET